MSEHGPRKPLRFAAAAIAVAITAAAVTAGESGTKKLGFDNGEIACVSPGCGYGDPPMPCCD